MRKFTVNKRECVKSPISSSFTKTAGFHFFLINFLNSKVKTCYNTHGSLVPAGESSHQLVPINPPFADISRHSR